MKNSRWTYGAEQKENTYSEGGFIPSFSDIPRYGLAGISAMYLNGGYGRGISWVYEETYEDSDTFSMKLGKDIENIFTYIGYKDLFETNGQLDMSKPIVRLMDGPG